jgi:GR25 family glycosyltransferase involved in LPS biosynthesis
MNVPDNQFVINLEHRPDRLKDFLEQASHIECLSPRRWSAISGDKCPNPENWTAGAGAWGCYKSHLNIIEYCLNEGIPSVLIFEDDAQFTSNSNQVFKETFEHIPEDWDQIYFGGQLLHTESRIPLVINDYILRPFNVNRTHCFALSTNGMEKVYPYISNLPFYRGEHIDHHLGRLHEDYEFKVYCPPKWCVGQHGSSSNVSGRSEEVQFYKDPVFYSQSHWLYDTPACVLFRCNKKLKESSKKYLHYGNSLTPEGYDKNLHLASKYRYPGPAITEWYNWVRSECAHPQSTKIPAAFHPFLTEELLKQAGVKNVLVLEHLSTELEIANEVKQFLQYIRKTNLGKNDAESPKP